jgi:glycosyltransferase involved in cell wall biosynthesis
LLLSVWGSDVYDFPYKSVFKKYLARFNLRKATAIASTSHTMAGQVRRLVPDINNVIITPFGVDIKYFTPRPELRESGWITIGIVKTLASKYGIDLLLHAFAKLLADPRISTLPQGCRLLVVGDGPQRGELELLATKLDIIDHTCFIGAIPHDEVPGWLNRFDIYCAPSRLDSESFGVAVIEAGACGLPVVVSDAGGLPEVVQDGKTGLVVPRENVEALQHALMILLLDADMRKNLGQQGREHVAAIYDWRYCVDVMESTYAAIIKMYHEAG